MTESNQTPATTDYRVVSAREFLAGARKRKVAELPPSVLMREDAELRRLLGLVLDVIADVEDEELDENVTQLTLSGGAYLAPADVRTLADAAAHREPGAYCADCGGEGLCDTHAADLDAAGAYRALAQALGIEVDR